MKKPYTYALDLLAARAYTTTTLRRKLRLKEFEPAEIDETLERLTSSGILDDSKYAAEFARQRLVHGGSSVRRVEQDLAKKGIDRKTAHAAAQSVVDEEEIDLAASMERIARKKLLTMGGLDAQTRRRRLFGFLVRKGYDLDDIKRAVERLCP